VTYLQLWFKATVSPVIGWLESLGTELSAALSDGRVWAAFGVALLFGTITLLVGLSFARRVGLLEANASHSDSLGVGLGLGLVVLAALWAAGNSGGRSSFTPIAVAFLGALALTARPRPAQPSADVSTIAAAEPTWAGLDLRPWLRVGAIAAVFIVVVGLVYGSTMAPRPRDGLQPVEFNDEAYYAVLGADLAATGLESVFPPSGFDSIEGVPTQSWYHWGELWLASAVIKVTGIEPMLARYYVVLPLILLAVAALTGTLVQRLAGIRSRRVFLSSAAAGIVLAPMPLLLSTFFSTWARGSIYGVTQYGITLIIGLLVLHAYATRREQSPWSWSLMVGAIAASLVAAHIVIAAVAVLGVAALWIVRFMAHAFTGRLLPIPRGWRQTLISACLIGLATIGWGLATGHGFAGTGSSADLAPYSGYWFESVLSTAIGGGVFFAIPMMWWVTRKRALLSTWLFLATTLTLLGGALVWGARLADFNSFHFFFGPVLVFGSPVAAVGVWVLVGYARAAGRRTAVAVVLTIFGFQLILGAVSGMQRLRAFGAYANRGTPLELLAVIRSLPLAAKLAYACRPLEEVAAWVPSLASIEAHTGRRVVPMCFGADALTTLNGGVVSPHLESPLFRLAPQRALYPDSSSHPSSADIASFLRNHGINYIYADATHPNSLVPEAMLLASSGRAQLFRLP
jgi:hypothetical protein